MSTKTIKQRIALVAVSALTAGLFSVVSAPASYALDNVAPGTASPAAADTVLNIATTTNTSGVAVLGTGASDDATRSSVGLLTTSDLAGTRKAQTTQTATLLANGTLVVYTSSAATKVAMITVSGGTISQAANADAINSGLTAAANLAGTASAELITAIKPNAGATTMTVTLTVATTGTAAQLLAGTTSGTLTGQIFVTIAASSVAGTLAASKSGIFYDADGTATAITADEAVAGIGTYAYDTSGFAVIRARDAYSTAMSAGLLTATATNGALVSFGAGVTTPAASTTFSASAPDTLMMTVAAPSSSPVSTVVTVAHNGVLIGTKAFTFTGQVAKITLSAPKNGLTGNSAAGHNTATVTFSDSAGNLLALDGTANPAGGFGTLATSDYALALSTAPTAALGGQGTVTFSCGALSSSGKSSATYTNNNGVVITSNALDLTCSKIAFRYTASYNKASYAPGEIAVLTVAFTDVDGKSAADSLTSAADNATNTAAVISESGATKVGAAHAADDARTSNGKLTYNYIVGQTEGTFTNSISFPQVNTNGAALAVGATTATLTVKSSTTAVSNADVLKSIVALIASINKQIQALQKLILKR
jgi:hypothetical protein